MKPYYRRPLNRTTGAAWAQTEPVPFECTGEAYTVRYSPAELFSIDQSASPFTFIPIDLNGPAVGNEGVYAVIDLGAGDIPIELNNLGFRSTDGLLYAMALRPLGGASEVNGNYGIVQIDSNGDIFGPLAIQGDAIPGIGDNNYRFAAGDVSPNGNTMVINSLLNAENSTGTTGYIYIVDLTTTPVTVTEKQKVFGDNVPANLNVADWAVNPIDQKLYGASKDDGHIYKLDPDFSATHVQITRVTTSPLLPTGGGSISAFGGAWFNSLGRAFFYRNVGEIYPVDDVGGTPVLVSAEVQTAGPSSIFNDAAACAAPDASAIRLVKTVDPPLVPADGGGDVTYSYEITNLSAQSITLTSLNDDKLGDLSDLVSGTVLLAGASTTVSSNPVLITEPITNVATACGEDGAGNQSCDDDSAQVDVYGIEIHKKPVSQKVESDGTAYFTIILENTGSVDLTNVTVTDGLAMDCERTAFDLAAGDTLFYDCTESGVTGAFTNLATADGFAGDIPVTADDSADVTLCAGGPQPPNYDGCTPGFWGSTESVALLWGAAGYSTSDDFDTTFSTFDFIVDYFDPDITLGEAINGDVPRKQKKLATLARHGTSALLNEGHPDVVYEFSKDVVIGIVQAYPDAYEGYTLDDLVTANERSGTCPAK
jgi:hypothetical protein